MNWTDGPTDFQDFQARFAPFFARSEPREAARRYLRGLLAPVQRKNCWQMAEVVGEQDPQPMQRLLYSARWDEDEVRDELQCFVVEQFGDEAGIGVVDETGFLKKGTKSVGVKRQYTWHSRQGGELPGRRLSDLLCSWRAYLSGPASLSAERMVR